MNKNIDNVINKITELKTNYPQLVHASNICKKLEQYKAGELKEAQNNAICNIANVYSTYIENQLNLNEYTEECINKKVALLNNYYNYLFEHNYDNIFTSQGKLRPTILEEFMFLLFKDLVNSIQKGIKDDDHNLKLGSVKAYTNLYFKSEDINSFIHDIQTGVNVKDQDFAIYRQLNLSINNNLTEVVNLPIIAIEVKTYLDKTMLEGAIATAEKIKMGNPYSKFFVVAENYDVDLKVDPAYSRIDQIFVLRKTKRSATPRMDIQQDVVWLLTETVKNFSCSRWGDIEKKLKDTGTII